MKTPRTLSIALVIIPLTILFVCGASGATPAVTSTFTPTATPWWVQGIETVRANSGYSTPTPIPYRAPSSPRPQLDPAILATVLILGIPILAGILSFVGASHAASRNMWRISDTRFPPWYHWIVANALAWSIGPFCLGLLTFLLQDTGSGKPAWRLDYAIWRNADRLARWVGGGEWGERITEWADDLVFALGSQGYDDILAQLNAAIVVAIVGLVGAILLRTALRRLTRWPARWILVYAVSMGLAVVGIGVHIGVVLAGLIIGVLLQWLVLRYRVERAWQWVAVLSAGAVFTLLADFGVFAFIAVGRAYDGSPFSVWDSVVFLIVTAPAGAVWGGLTLSFVMNASGYHRE